VCRHRPTAPRPPAAHPGPGTFAVVVEPRTTDTRFLFVLLGVFALVAGWSAWGATSTTTWLLENLVVTLGLLVLFFTRRALPLSRASYVLILVFLVLHEVGAHWTFAEVPYEAWTRAWFGRGLNEALGLERNHYDRLVHTAYGLLLALPMLDAVRHGLGLQGRGAAFVVMMIVSATSTFYELLEWAAAIVFGEGGMAFLGTQGDPWDAHKDMALAILGCLAFLLPWAMFRRRGPEGTPAGPDRKGGAGA
jgi:putative membrane protein